MSKLPDKWKMIDLKAQDAAREPKFLKTFLKCLMENQNGIINRLRELTEGSVEIEPPRKKEGGHYGCSTCGARYEIIIQCAGTHAPAPTVCTFCGTLSE